MTDTPSFIFGVHHFCDHRCWRCPLAARCRVHDRWRRIREPASLRKQPAARVARVVKATMEVTLEEVTEMAELHGMTLDPGSCDASSAVDDAAVGESRYGAAAETPLGVAAREYAELSFQSLRALRGLLATRRDADGLDACDRLEEMCFGVASKILRCLTSAGRPDHDPADLQGDANGSAKVVLLIIEESRQAWRVLMQPGRARGGGAPGRFVAMLDGLEAGVLRSFPRAFEFVRPGFDTGGLAGPGGEISRALLLSGAGGKAAPN